MASGDIAAVCSGKFLFRRVDRRHPKGAEKPLDVFEKDWLRTLAALQEFAADYPDDVVAGIYLSPPSGGLALFGVQHLLKLRS